MNVDQSFDLAKVLCTELEARLSEIETEQDARFQMINRFLTEVLGWGFPDIKTEPHSEAGYTDYLLSSAGQKRLVIEAKRAGPILIDTQNESMRTYKVGGPALASSKDGINQAVSYCVEYGVNYAALTTGNLWIAFVPLPGAGTSFKDGLAFVFPNFKSILDNYAIFYDLFSKEGVASKNYSLQFAKVNGLSVAEFEPLISANRTEFIHMLTQSDLAAALEPVFREFFGSLVDENNNEMLTECFVETRESQFADASLEKMVRNVSSHIAELTPDSDNQLAQEIQAAVETGRGETVILVGNNGAGKSTFIKRFFDRILDPTIRKQCSVIKIDLRESPGDISSINAWLTTKIKANIEPLLYEDGNPTYEELQGLYFREYQRWMKGQYKPLYETDKNAFKVKFSDFLNEQIERDTYSYVLRLLDDTVKNRKLLPCITFDNSDHFDVKFQEAVFQFSQAIHETVPFTFIVMPITDHSMWQLSKAGPFQAYPSKMFYLPVPPTKEVLEKRVEYLKRKIEENKDRPKYFAMRGIKLRIETIKGFAACLEEVFIREDFVSRRISWIANNNLGKSLELAQQIILSPFFSVDELVSAYVAHDSNAPLKMNYKNFMRALIFGKYNAFVQDKNLDILNVFTISPYLPTTPFLKLSILKMLIDKMSDGSNVAGYMSVDQARQYLEAMNITEPAVDEAMNVLLKFRLIEPYDASDWSINSSQRIAITHSGRMHFEMAMTDRFYVSAMAFATPIRNVGVVDKLRAIKAKKMTTEDWHNIQMEFFQYSVDQDHIFANVPKDSLYDGQRQMRADLQNRWVKPKPAIESMAYEDVPEILQESASGYSHIPAQLKWFNSEKGYGFLAAGLSEDVFLHKNVLEQSQIGEVGPGDTLICDVAMGAKGKLQVIAIHSVQKYQAPINAAESAPEELDGVVDFYNSARQFGFARTLSMEEGIYLSAKVLESAGIKELLSGMKIKIRVGASRYGNGLMATSLRLMGE